MRRHPGNQTAIIFMVKSRHYQRPQTCANSARRHGPTRTLLERVDILQTVRDVGERRRSDSGSHEESPSLRSCHGADPVWGGAKSRRKHHDILPSLVLLSLPLTAVAFHHHESPSKSPDYQGRAVEEGGVGIHRSLYRSLGRLDVPFPRPFLAGRRDFE